MNNAGLMSQMERGEATLKQAGETIVSSIDRAADLVHRVGLVCFVYLVDSVHLVSLVYRVVWFKLADVFQHPAKRMRS